MDRIEIIEYEDQHHQKFKELAYEWLIKYDLLEPEDEVILNNPRSQILNQGGKIFYATYNGEIVGTSSIIKLGVTECYQRMGIARMLVEKCILVSKEKSVKTLILYTNHKLIAAANLYKQFGFVEVDITKNKYLEADTKLKLDL